MSGPLHTVPNDKLLDMCVGRLRVIRTRFHPAGRQQKKVIQVWQPKKTIHNQPVGEKEIGDKSGENTQGDQLAVGQTDSTIIASSITEDLGWRVVIKINREPRVIINSVGLAQVHDDIQGSSRGGDGGGDMGTFPIYAT